MHSPSNSNQKEHRSKHRRILRTSRRRQRSNSRTWRVRLRSSRTKRITHTITRPHRSRRSRNTEPNSLLKCRMCLRQKKLSIPLTSSKCIHPQRHQLNNRRFTRSKKPTYHTNSNRPYTQPRHRTNNTLKSQLPMRLTYVCQNA